MQPTKKELLEMITMIENAASMAAMPKRDHALCQQAAEMLRKFVEDTVKDEKETKDK